MSETKNKTASGVSIAVKNCRMLRSGVLYYSKDEVPEEFLSRVPDKAVYSVYRRPEAVVACFKDCNYIHLVNDHPTKNMLTHNNWKQYSVGRSGGIATLTVLDDKNVYVENEVLFDDEEAYNAYSAGKTELSIGITDADWIISENPKYDFEQVALRGVNHVALVAAGRSGVNARVLDTAAHVNKLLGGNGMAGILERLGIIPKSKKAEDKKGFSAQVLDSAAKIAGGSLDAVALEAEVKGVMEKVTPLGDSEDKTVLIGIVTDSLSNAQDVAGADAESKKKLAESLDGLYEKCVCADDKKAKAIVDAVTKKDSDDGGDDDEDDDDDTAGKKKKKSVEDDASKVSVEDMIKKVLNDSLPSMVEKAVKSALNIDESADSAVKKSAVDSAVEYDFTISGWGNRG